MRQIVTFLSNTGKGRTYKPMDLFPLNCDMMIDKVVLNARIEKRESTIERARNLARRLGLKLRDEM